MTLTCESFASIASDEPRRSGRIEVRRTVKLFEPFAGDTFFATTCNVSVDGVCLELTGDVRLRPGRFVTLHDAPAAGPRLCDAAPRATTARVVWVIRDPADPARHRVGLQLYERPVAAAA